MNTDSDQQFFLGLNQQKQMPPYGRQSFPQQGMYNNNAYIQPPLYNQFNPNKKRKNNNNQPFKQLTNKRHTKIDEVKKLVSCINTNYLSKFTNRDVLNADLCRIIGQIKQIVE